MLIFGHRTPCVIPEPKTFNVDEEWARFRREHEKSYPTVEEVRLRKRIFQLTLLKIEESNSFIDSFQDGKSRGRMGITPSSDYTEEEHLKYSHHPSYEPTAAAEEDILGAAELEKMGEDSRKDILAGIRKEKNWLRRSSPVITDWEAQGYVSQVSDQGLCGCCWAFSSTAVLETHFFRLTGERKKFSTQYLIDCNNDNRSQFRCGGGKASRALKFIGRYGHVENQHSTYKCYDNHSHECRTSRCPANPRIAMFPGPAYRLYWAKEEKKGRGKMRGMIAGLQLGPLVVAVEAKSEPFRHYVGGILREDQCGKTIGHTMTLVGYGVENGVEYWRVKNSWGVKWGERGYIRLHKGALINTCNIYREVVGVQVKYFSTPV